jgi:glycosyltransferase involved in cell wall biosynthesis
MKRSNLLLIGRDRSALTPQSPLQQRLALYDTYHTMHLVIMAVGERQTCTIGQSTVVTPGGKTLVGAFFNAIIEARRQLKSEPGISLVSTQDVLYAGVVGYLISRLSGLPLYVQLHGDYLDNPAWFASSVGFGNRFMNVVGKWILRRADAIRVVSQRLLEQIIREQGIAREKLISIPIGTDLSIFSQTAPAEREKTILFVGRLIPEKEPMLFCAVATKIAQEFPDVRIGIAGDGFLREEMSVYFAEHEILDRVQFYGSLDQKTLASRYARSWCYIHTAGWEGWGMPMIESMAAGCPVVTTDSGCAGEAIRHEETGLVVPVGEAGLIQSTRRLLNDESLWQKLVEHGKTEATHWSITHLAELNMQWYANKQ